MTSVKEKAKARDDRQCQKCSYKPSSSSQLHAHHIHPSSLGGEDTVDNLITLCSRCHEFAPIPRNPISNYERVTEIFINTHMRPEWDMMYFGVLLGKSNEWGSEDISKSFHQNIFMAHLKGDTMPREPSNLWLLGAIFADVDDIREHIDLPVPTDFSEYEGEEIRANMGDQPDNET